MRLKNNNNNNKNHHFIITIISSVWLCDELQRRGCDLCKVPRLQLWPIVLMSKVESVNFPANARKYTHEHTQTYVCQKAIGTLWAVTTRWTGPSVFGQMTRSAGWCILFFFFSRLGFFLSVHSRRLPFGVCLTCNQAYNHACPETNVKPWEISGWGGRCY